MLSFEIFSLFFCPMKNNQNRWKLSLTNVDEIVREPRAGLLRFQNTLTTNFQKTSLTWEIDCYSYIKLPGKNSRLKNPGKIGESSIPVNDYLKDNIF